MSWFSCLIADYGLFVAAGLGVVGVCHAFLTQMRSKSRAALMLAIWSVTVGTVIKAMPPMTEACYGAPVPAVEAPVKP